MPYEVVNGEWNDKCGKERMPPLVNELREPDGCPNMILVGGAVLRFKKFVWFRASVLMCLSFHHYSSAQKL